MIVIVLSQTESLGLFYLVLFRKFSFICQLYQLIAVNLVSLKHFMFNNMNLAAKILFATLIILMRF